MPSVRWAWWDGGEMLWLFCAPRLKASGKQHIRLIDEWLGRFETCVRSIENGGGLFSPFQARVVSSQRRTHQCHLFAKVEMLQELNIGDLKCMSWLELLNPLHLLHLVRSNNAARCSKVQCCNCRNRRCAAPMGALVGALEPMLSRHLHCEFSGHGIKRRNKLTTLRST